MSQKPLLKSRLFKLPQHRRFNFPARYYDENKERLENRIKIPMIEKKRSLNLASSVAIILSENIRQTNNLWTN